MSCVPALGASCRKGWRWLSSTTCSSYAPRFAETPARPLGGRSPLHVASNGKAVLASMSATEQEAYLTRPLKPSTRHTITDPEALRAELERIRKLGYAVSLGELDEGVRAVAAPILGVDAAPIGSISISCPAQRLPDELIPRYGGWVRSAAKEIRQLAQAWV